MSYWFQTCELLRGQGSVCDGDCSLLGEAGGWLVATMIKVQIGFRKEQSLERQGERDERSVPRVKQHIQTANLNIRSKTWMEISTLDRLRWLKLRSPGGNPENICPIAESLGRADKNIGRRTAASPSVWSASLKVASRFPIAMWQPPPQLNQSNEQSRPLQ